MIIRPIQDADYEEVAALRRETIQKINARDYEESIIRGWAEKRSPAYFRETAKEFKRWVADENGQVIGFSEHGDACEVTRMYVHKDHLRKGVGSKLLKTAESSLIEKGCRSIMIESTITARGFYEKHGYTMIEKFYYEDDGAEIYRMSKEIEG